MEALVRAHCSVEGCGVLTGAAHGFCRGHRDLYPSRKSARVKRDAKYNTSPKGRAAQAKHAATPKRKADVRSAVARHAQTPWGKSCNALRSSARHAQRQVHKPLSLSAVALAEVFRTTHTCAYCGERIAAFNKIAEHCHETGELRGITCRPCNKRIHATEALTAKGYARYLATGELPKAGHTARILHLQDYLVRGRALHAAWADWHGPLTEDAYDPATLPALDLFW